MTNETITNMQAAVSEPDTDVDLAKMVVRSAGYNLVSQRFIVNFAEFIQDWRKGDFDLPPLAACDVEACFEAWQEDVNQKEVTTKPAAAKEVQQQSQAEHQTVPELTDEDVRAVGGIVHRDGNIFFTNIEMLNKVILAAQRSKK